MAAIVTIGIVGCAKRKRAEACAARSLYASPLFRRALRYAESRCDATYIASALHELVHPDDVINPYDRILKGYGKRLRFAWGSRVVERIAGRHRATPIRLVILAGADYAQPIRAACHYRGWEIEEPLRGLSLGQRLEWLRCALEEGTEIRSAPVAAPAARSRTV
jgi:hypothetical protein